MLKNHIYQIVLVFLFGSIYLIGYSQKYSNEFLAIGVSAKAQGLGNAVVAKVDDVTAGFWNPSGLASFGDNRNIQIGAMHSEWFAGVGQYDYLGVTMPLASSGKRLGLSMIRFGIDQIPNTLTLYEDDGTINFDNITEFSEADYAFFLSYAQPIKTAKGKLQVGGNIKVIHRRIGPFATSWGFGADLGVQWKPGKWSFGAVAKDVTTTFNAWSFSFTDAEKQVLEITNNEIPINSVEITNPRLILGMNRHFQIKSFGISPELDLVITTDGERNTLISADPLSIDPAFGIELDYNRFLFLRAGVNQFQRETNFDNSETLLSRPSIGVGLKISSLKVDYAFTDIGDERETFSHVISLLLDLKPKSASNP